MTHTDAYRVSYGPYGSIFIGFDSGLFYPFWIVYQFDRVRNFGLNNDNIDQSNDSFFFENFWFIGTSSASMHFDCTSKILSLSIADVESRC